MQIPVPGPSDLAGFKAFGQWMDESLAAFGWTRAADTGQVDWSTLATLPATLAAAANFIYLAADALAATHPIAVRVRLHYSSGLNVSVDVGRGTTGAGALAQVIYSLTGVSGAATTKWANCLASGDASSFVIGMEWASGAAAANTGAALILDRSRDLSGQATDEYVFCALIGTAASNYGGNVVVFKDNSIGPVCVTQGAHLACAYVAPNNGTAAYGGTSPISPIFPLTGRLGNPTIRAIAANHVDYATGVSLTVNLYGTSRTFRALFAALATNSGRLCVAWE